MSCKYLGKQVAKFVHVHNIRGEGSMEKMSNLVYWLIEKRLGMVIELLPTC